MQQKDDPFGNAPLSPPPTLSLSGADREHLVEPDGTQNQLHFVLQNKLC